MCLQQQWPESPRIVVVGLQALGDYLEKQRQGFARFYFVGDEDLLELIGSAKDPVKVQKHFSKMFAGISSLGECATAVQECT